MTQASAGDHFVAATVLSVVLVRRNLRPAVAIAAMAPVVFFLTNRIFSPQFLILLLAAWAVGLALVAESRREQLPLGAAALGATFANDFVGQFVLWNHNRTWLACSVVMFVLAIAITAWILRRSLGAMLRPC